MSKDNHDKGLYKRNRKEAREKQEKKQNPTDKTLEERLHLLPAKRKSE